MCKRVYELLCAGQTMCDGNGRVRRHHTMRALKRHHTNECAVPSRYQKVPQPVGSLLACCAPVLVDQGHAPVRMPTAGVRAMRARAHMRACMHASVLAGTLVCPIPDEDPLGGAPYPAGPHGESGGGEAAAPRSLVAVHQTLLARAQRDMLEGVLLVVFLVTLRWVLRKRSVALSRWRAADRRTELAAGGNREDVWEGGGVGRGERVGVDWEEVWLGAEEEGEGDVTEEEEEEEKEEEEVHQQPQQAQQAAGVDQELGQGLADGRGHEQRQQQQQQQQLPCRGSTSHAPDCDHNPAPEKYTPEGNLPPEH